MADLWDEVARRYDWSAKLGEHLRRLFACYLESGLAPPHMLAEIKTADEQKLWAHIWEAQLYRHFRLLGFDFRTGLVSGAGQVGPDFGIVNGDRTIWVEATVPGPEGICLEWISPPTKSATVKAKPYNQILLRYTSAFAAKSKVFREYRDKGIVGSRDMTIIAISGCRLYDHAFEDRGISGLQFPVEAAFPVGPLAIPLDENNCQSGEQHNIPRYHIPKISGASVSTIGFLDRHHSHVSALLGGFRKFWSESELGLTLVHNPLAENPLLTGILGASTEFEAVPEGDEVYSLRVVERAASSFRA